MLHTLKYYFLFLILIYLRKLSADDSVDPKPCPVIEERSLHVMKADGYYYAAILIEDNTFISLISDSQFITKCWMKLDNNLQYHIDNLNFEAVRRNCNNVTEVSDFRLAQIIENLPGKKNYFEVCKQELIKKKIIKGNNKKEITRPKQENSFKESETSPPISKLPERLEIDSFDCSNPSVELRPIPSRPNCYGNGAVRRTGTPIALTILRRKPNDPLIRSYKCDKLEAQAVCTTGFFGSQDRSRILNSVRIVGDIPLELRRKLESNLRNSTEPELEVIDGKPPSHYCSWYTTQVRTSTIYNCKLVSLNIDISRAIEDVRIMLPSGNSRVVDLGKVEYAIDMGSYYIWKSRENEDTCPYEEVLHDACILVYEDGFNDINCKHSALSLSLVGGGKIIIKRGNRCYRTRDILVSSDGTVFSTSENLTSIELNSDQLPSKLSLDSASLRYAIGELASKDASALAELSHQVCLNAFSIWYLALAISSSNPTMAARSFYRDDNIISTKEMGTFLITRCISRKTYLDSSRAIQCIRRDVNSIVVEDGALKKAYHYETGVLTELNKGEEIYECRHHGFFLHFNSSHAAYMPPGSNKFAAIIPRSAFFQEATFSWVPTIPSNPDLYTFSELTAQNMLKSRLDIITEDMLILKDDAVRAGLAEGDWSLDTSRPSQNMRSVASSTWRFLKSSLGIGTLILTIAITLFFPLLSYLVSVTFFRICLPMRKMCKRKDKGNRAEILRLVTNPVNKY